MKLKDVKPKRRIGKKSPSKTVLLITDIREMRTNMGVSLRECVKPSGIGLSTLSRIEAGFVPDLERALRVAAFLDLPIEKIWRLARPSSGEKETKL